jgi:hypothetical protein
VFWAFALCCEKKVAKTSVERRKFTFFLIRKVYLVIDQEPDQGTIREGRKMVFVRCF